MKSLIQSVKNQSWSQWARSSLKRVSTVSSCTLHSNWPICNSRWRRAPIRKIISHTTWSCRFLSELKNLFDRQNINGGFSLWRKGTPEIRKIYHFLTSFPELNSQVLQSFYQCNLSFIFFHSNKYTLLISISSFSLIFPIIDWILTSNHLIFTDFSINVIQNWLKLREFIWKKVHFISRIKIYSGIFFSFNWNLFEL